MSEENKSIKREYNEKTMPLSYVPPSREVTLEQIGIIAGNPAGVTAGN